MAKSNMEPGVKLLPPKPPNGGWGWVVVVASFCSNFIVDGTLYTFGIFFVELLISFEAPKTTTSLVGSLLGGMYLMVGPLVSALANKFGCRNVAICGSLLASTFFFISTYSTSIEMLLFTYGIVGGIGFGMMYLPSIVMVGLYFDTKRSMATGIAVCGSGLGTFVFAPLARALLDNYGWRGANKIIAGIILHGVAAGLVYRPLMAIKVRESATVELQTITNNDNDENDNRDQLILGAQPDSGENGVEFKMADAEAAEDAARPMNRKDVLYGGSVTNLTEFKTNPDIAAYTSSVTSIPKKSKKGGFLSNVKNTLLTIFDFKLLLSPTFLIVCISGACGFLGFFTPFMYIADYAIGQGIGSRTASLLLSVIGISNTLGRLVAGWLADRPWADSLIIHNVAAILAGAATCLLPVFIGAGLLFAYSAFFGMTLAAFIALRSIVLCDLLGVEKLTNAFGIVSLFQGVALLIGTPFSGYLYDSTGSYSISFVIAGSILALGGVVCLPARRIAAWEEARNKRKAEANAYY